MVAAMREEVTGAVEMVAAVKGEVATGGGAKQVADMAVEGAEEETGTVEWRAET